MKTLIFSAAMLLIGATTFAQTPKKLSEGTLIYSVEWKLPEQLQSMAASFPTEIKVQFRGDSSSLKTESPMYSSTNITNISREYERLLLDIPMMKKKFSVIFTPADQDKIAANLPELALKAGTETKTVAGYNATKVDVTEKKSNQTSTAWFTKDIEVSTQNPLTRAFDKSYGFPVEFTSDMNGMSVRAVLKEIKTEAVPAGAFGASKDYEEITFEQLSQMQGGR
jgi:GLPGLI family protein